MCCANMRTLSLIIGWIHLLVSGIMSISLLIYLCIYHNKTYEGTELEEQVTATGLPTIIFLFLFCVASLIFDLLLLRGISQERYKLMMPFVFGNYVAIGIVVCLTAYNFVMDLIEAATFGDIMIHLTLNGVTVGMLIFFFYPVYQLYQQMRLYNEQPEHCHLRTNVDVEKPPTPTTANVYVN